MTKIASKKPDVIAIGALFPEATKIIQQAGKLGLKVHMIGGNGLNSPDMYSVAGPAAQGTVVGAAWFQGAKYPSNIDFVKRFTAKYGKPPDQFAAQSYAAAQIVAYVVAHGATNSADVLKALQTLSQVQTVLGPIAFDTKRDVSRRRSSWRSSKTASLIFTSAFALVKSGWKGAPGNALRAPHAGGVGPPCLGGPPHCGLAGDSPRARLGTLRR